MQFKDRRRPAGHLPTERMEVYLHCCWGSSETTARKEIIYYWRKKICLFTGDAEPDDRILFHTHAHAHTQTHTQAL